MSSPTIQSSGSPSTAAPWPVVGALCQRELVRFFRQKNRVFGALGQPIIFWLLFSAGLQQARVNESSSLDYAHFFPGTIVMILLFTAIFATISIIEDRREGFLQGVLVAPIPRWSMVLGKVLGGAAIAMLQGLLFLVLVLGFRALGWTTFKDVSPSILSFVAAVLLMSVISIALTALGFIIAWRMDSTQGFHAVMSVFLFPMWLLSGAFFPLTVQGWMKPIVWANPLTYGVAGLRQALQNMSEETAATLPSPALSWLVSLVFAGAMLAGAYWIAKTRSTGDLL